MKAFAIDPHLMSFTSVCLVILVLSGADRVIGAEISSTVSRIDGVRLFSEYPRNVRVWATNSVGVDQWTDGLLVQPEATTNTFIIAFKVLPDAESATIEFNKLTVMESSGGGGQPPPKVGDQAVMFGPSRIMIRRVNVLVTAFSKGRDVHDYQEIEGFVKFIDEKIRDRGTGIIAQTSSP